MKKMVYTPSGYVEIETTAARQGAARFVQVVLCLIVLGPAVLILAASCSGSAPSVADRCVSDTVSGFGSTPLTAEDIRNIRSVCESRS